MIFYKCKHVSKTDRKVYQTNINKNVAIRYNIERLESQII